MARNHPTSLKCDTYSNRAYVRWQGKKIYFGKWESQEATRSFAAWLSSVATDPAAVRPGEKTTVAQCVERYLVFAEAYYSEDGVRSQEFLNVRAAMGTLLEFAGSAQDFAVDFGPLRLAEIQRRLAAQKKNEDSSEAKYARTSINARIHRIRRCFRWCAAQELIPASIVTALDMVPGLKMGRTQAREPEPVESVPISVVRATLPFVSPTVGVMFRVQMLCGMRPQDVCRMTTGAIDKTKEIWLYRPEKHKTSHLGQALVKAIPPAAQKLLLPLLRENPDEPIFSPFESLEYWRSLERKRVISQKQLHKQRKRPRKAYTTASYGKAVVYAIDRASKQVPPVTIPHWTVNQLRHSIATQLRESVGIEAAQLFLGHAKPDTTLIYAEKSIAALAEVARQLVSPFDELTVSRE